MIAAIRYLGLSLCCSALLALPASAQRVAGAEKGAIDPISRELAISLMTTLRLDTTTMRAGAADGLPPNAIHPKATVIGNYNLSNRTATFVSFPLGSIMTMDSLRSHLSAHGWRPVATAAPPRPGFSTTTMPGTGGRGSTPPPSTYYCLGRDALRFAQSRAYAMRTVIALEFVREVNVQPCSPALRGALDATPLPVLNHPPGVRLIQGGVLPPNPNTFSAFMRVATLDSLPRLLRHYGDQMMAAGWVAMDSVSSNGIASRTFRIKPVGSTETWEAILSAYRVDADGTIQLHVWGRRG